MTTLQPPFDDCLFALSTISHRLEFPRRFNHSPSQQKHLKLLNFLALLMVTEAKGDVAATTIIRSPGSVTILFSKNRPCTVSELSYFHALKDIITSATQETIKGTRKRAISLVIDNCSQKIKARLKKLVRQLKSGFTVKPPPPETSTHLSKRLQPMGFTPDTPFEISITQWLTYLIDETTSALTGTDGIMTLFIAHGIGYTPGIESVIDDPVLLRRLQKLGDYSAAIRCLVANYIELGPDHTITIREIEPPPPRTIALRSDVLGTVNAWASHRGHPPLTPDSLLSAYPDLIRSSLFAPHTTLTTTVHAECTLLIHLITLNLSLLEIGASKNICWACECFIAVLDESYTGVILYWGRQGKVHAGWRFPEGTSVAVRERAEQRLSHEMDSVLARAMGSTHSDSEPGGDEEEDSEEDMSAAARERPWTMVE